MTLTPNDLMNLIAIRSLRNLAANQASTPGGVHRQTAVILLDAAIERTAFTAAEHLHHYFKDNDFVDKPLQALREEQWEPGSGVETARRRLRRVRNGVQHSGIGVDPEELPGWVIATEQFIASVVLFAYGVELDEVRYSSAVEDERIREHLDAGEALIASGDSDAAMRSVIKAYEVVAGTWNSFVVSSNSELAPRRASRVPGMGRVGGDDPKVVALQEVALLTAIASEPSEALWFLEAKQSPDLLNLEEVQRGLVFVFNFATAVEGSPAARREDRRRRRNVARRHERRSHDAHARIGSFRVKRIGDRMMVRFTLVDVPPPSEYDEWAQVINDELNARSSGRRRYRVEEDGTLFVDEVDRESVGADVTRIEATLAGSESSVLARRATVAAEFDQSQHTADEFRSRVAQAIPDDLPSWLNIGVTHAALSHRRLAVQVQLDPATVSPYTSELRRAFDKAGASAYRTERGWIVNSIEPEDIPAYAAKLVSEIEAIITKQAEQDAEHENELYPIVDELNRRGYPRDCS